MPSISYQRAEYQQSGMVADVLDFRPLLTDRAAELLCRYTTKPYVMVVPTSGDFTRIRVESNKQTPHDIETVARELGSRAYPGDQVEIINAQK